MPDDGMNKTLADLADRFDVSQAAVRHLAEAIKTGGGSMAMFNHPDFGGPGQWMRGGLVMLSGPDDPARRYKIDALCDALSRLPATSLADDRSPSASASFATDTKSTGWWPPALGEPSATGTQNDLAYAYFDGSRRLAVRQGRDIALYDTGDHRITGVSQSQQGMRSHVIFTSQYGQVALDQLARCDMDVGEHRAAGAEASGPDIFSAIERLGTLRDRGLLTDAEFAAKKQELLSRL